MLRRDNLSVFTIPISATDHAGDCCQRRKHHRVVLSQLRTFGDTACHYHSPVTPQHPFSFTSARARRSPEHPRWLRRGGCGRSRQDVSEKLANTRPDITRGRQGTAAELAEPPSDSVDTAPRSVSRAPQQRLKASRGRAGRGQGLVTAPVPESSRDGTGRDATTAAAAAAG